MGALSKRPGYRPDIQGLRGVAVLLVVLFHAGLPLYGGYIGVDVFFVISGFVITRGIVRNLDRGTFSFLDFYVKRMRRLLPALSVMLVTVIILMPYLGAATAIRGSVRTGLAAALFNANHYLMRSAGYFAWASDFNPFLHTWSLSLEEQFYFLFPATLFVFWNVGNNASGRRRVVVGLLVLTILSFLACVYYSYAGSLWAFSGQKVAFYTILTRAWQFAVGALLALGITPISQTVWGKPWWMPIGLTMILTASIIYDDSTVFPGIAALLPTVGAMLVICGGMTRSKNLVYRLLSSKPMVRVGDLSYSWYLWHWPMIVFAAAMFPSIPLVATVSAGAVSYGAAVLSEKLIENPVRFRSREKWSPAWLVLTCCILTPVLAISGVRIQFNKILTMTDESSLTFRAIQSDVAYRDLECFGSNTPEEVLANCRWSSPSPNFDVYLIGDSNARQWIPMLSQLVPELNGSLLSATIGSCPFTDLNFVRSDKRQKKCDDWTKETMRQIETNRPDIVILASAIDNYIFGHAEFIDKEGKRYQTSEEKREVYIDTLRRISKKLNSVGTEILIVEPVPKFVEETSENQNWVYRGNSRGKDALSGRCSAFSLWVQPAWCLVARHLHDARYRDLSVVRSILQDVPAHIVYVGEDFCSDDRCVSLRFDPPKILYRDSSHIAQDGAFESKDTFRKAILTALE